MTAVQIPYSAPHYIINTTDISGSKVSGVSVIGSFVYDVDAKKWYVVASDLKLVDLVWNTAA